MSLHHCVICGDIQETLRKKFYYFSKMKNVPLSKTDWEFLKSDKNIVCEDCINNNSKQFITNNWTIIGEV